MMPVAKVTISLPEELLAEIDKLAEECGQSRSMVIQKATARYLTQRLSDDMEARRLADFDRGMEALARLQAMMPRDSRPSLEILHEIREESLRSSGEDDE